MLLHDLAAALEAEESVFNMTDDPCVQDASWHRLQALRTQISTEVQRARAAQAAGKPIRLLSVVGRRYRSTIYIAHGRAWCPVHSLPDARVTVREPGGRIWWETRVEDPKSTLWAELVEWGYGLRHRRVRIHKGPGMGDGTVISEVATMAEAAEWLARQADGNG